MKKLLLILTASFALVGCASLTKTQVEAVNQFAQTSKDFSLFPGKIMTELAEIRTKRGTYYANSLGVPELHIGVLDSVYFNKNHAFKVSSKVDITFKIIDKYAQSLILLSSDKYEKDLEKQAKNFGVGIDSLVKIYNNMDNSKNLPTGIGSSVSKLIIMGGKQYIRCKQAKEIQKFVPQADTLISVMTTNLLEFLQSKNINTLIMIEENGIKQNYLSFLRQTPKATIENENAYLELKNSIDGVKKLQEQTIKATKDLRAAHKKLLLEIKKRKDLKELVKEIQVLYEQIKELKSTVEKIETSKQ